MARACGAAVPCRAVLVGTGSGSRGGQRDGIICVFYTPLFCTLNRVDTTIRFMRAHLATLGCVFKRSNFRCATNCPPNTAAMLRQDGVVVCFNSIKDARYSKKDIRDIIIHELIHAYDRCRANVVSDPYAVACSEIRAANLSGECGALAELRRGKMLFPLSIARHQQQCVYRRAFMSLKLAFPNLSDYMLRNTMDECMICYYDTAPFQKQP